MSLTPRQIEAFLEFSNAEKADQLTLTAVATQGDDKLIEKTRRSLSDGAIQSERGR
jgi:hypothetical protein